MLRIKYDAHTCLHNITAILYQQFFLQFYQTMNRFCTYEDFERLSLSRMELHTYETRCNKEIEMLGRVFWGRYRRHITEITKK
jgi:hypothetical protein